MMVSQAKILFYFVLLITLLSANAKAAIMTEDKLMADRSKRVVHLEHAMAQIKKQLDEHNSGLKNLDERRLKSLKNRLQSYKGQIYDASRTLSQEEIEELIESSSEL